MADEMTTPAETPTPAETAVVSTVEVVAETPTVSVEPVEDANFVTVSKAIDDKWIATTEKSNAEIQLYKQATKAVENAAKIVNSFLNFNK